jgi:methionyl aminopeptidase
MCVSSQIALALKECLGHGLLHAYPVLYEKPGELTAQIKGTVLLMPSGSDPVTKAPQQVGGQAGRG